MYRDLAERSWAWVQTQVRASDDGLWLPEKPDQTEPGEYPYGMHSGIGGLAHVLAEIRLTRGPDRGGARPRRRHRRDPGTPDRRTQTEYDYFDGLVSTIGVLTALEAPGADLAVARLLELATPDGWQPSFLGPPPAAPEARCNDVTLGTAGVLLGALWAMRHDVPGAAELADRAADVLLAERRRCRPGLDWPFVP